MSQEYVPREDYDQLRRDFDTVLAAARGIQGQRDRLIREMLGLGPSAVLRDPDTVVIKAYDWQENPQ